jgi:hypothetical protein
LSFRDFKGQHPLFHLLYSIFSTHSHIMLILWNTSSKSYIIKYNKTNKLDTAIKEVFVKNMKSSNWIYNLGREKECHLDIESHSNGC